jgi:hypothetical protein
MSDNNRWRVVLSPKFLGKAKGDVQEEDETHRHAITEKK